MADIKSKRANAAFAAMCTALTAAGYDPETDRESLSVQFVLPDGAADIMAAVDPQEEIVRLAASLPVADTFTRFKEIAKAVGIINYHLADGGFIAERGGGVVFRISASFKGGKLPSGSVDYMVAAAVSAARYGSRLNRVAEGVLPACDISEED